MRYIRCIVIIIIIIIINSAVKAREVGVSEGKEEALISLAHPNPLAFDRAQISSKTLARGKFGD